MDEMDFVMQNPDPLPGPSLPPPLRSACPYLAAQADSRPSPAMLQPSRTSPHYDPVHSSTLHWHHHLHPPPPLPPPPPPLPPYWLQTPTAPQHQPTGPPVPYPGSEHYSSLNSPASGLRQGSGPYRYSPAVPLEPLSFSAANMSFRHSNGMPGRMGGPPPAQPNGHGQQNPASSSMGTSARGLRGPMLSPIINDPFAPIPQQMPSAGPALSAAESGGSTSSQTRPPPSNRPLFGAAQPEQTMASSRTQHGLTVFNVVNPNHAASSASSAPQSSARSQAILDRFPLLDHPRTHQRPQSLGMPPPTNAQPPSAAPEIRRGTGSRRRPASGSSRSFTTHAYPDSDEDLDDLSDPTLRILEAMSGSPLRGDLDEDRVRQHQILRGALPTKRVASRSAIASLQSVEIGSLEKGDERVCVICYNEYGVANPEGINEAPLRLPKCKHVFGDHCIKKWFEESDSCPYCRDKLPSEPIFARNPQGMYHFLQAQQLAARSSRAPLRADAETFLRLVRNNPARPRQPQQTAEDSLSSNPPRPSYVASERRSPPSDSGEGRRRTRARHGSFRSSPPSNNARPNSFAGTIPPPVPQASPTRPDRYPTYITAYPGPATWSEQSGPRMVTRYQPAAQQLQQQPQQQPPQLANLSPYRHQSHGSHGANPQPHHFFQLGTVPMDIDLPAGGPPMPSHPYHQALLDSERAFANPLNQVGQHAERGSPYAMPQSPMYGPFGATGGHGGEGLEGMMQDGLREPISPAPAETWTANH